MIEVVQKPVVFVGFTASARGNPEEYLEKPSPPSNYGDEAKANWLAGKGAEMWAKIVREAAFRKLSGKIDRIFAIAPQDKKTFDEHEQAAAKFVKWLTKSLKYDPAQTVVIGFGAPEFVRVSGVDAVLAKQGTVPPGYWYQRVDAYDPYDMLTEEASRKYLPPAVMLSLIEFPAPETWSEPHVDPMLDAILAMHMAMELQLLPPCVDATKCHKTKIEIPEMPKAKEPVPEVQPEPVPEPAAAT